MEVSTLGSANPSKNWSGLSIRGHSPDFVGDVLPLFLTHTLCTKIIPIHNWTFQSLREGGEAAHTGSWNDSVANVLEDSDSAQQLPFGHRPPSSALSVRLLFLVAYFLPNLIFQLDQWWWHWALPVSSGGRRYFFFESLEILFSFGEVLTDITATSPASFTRCKWFVVRNPGFSPSLLQFLVELVMWVFSLSGAVIFSVSQLL